MKKLILIIVLLIPFFSHTQFYKEKDKQLHFAAGNIAGAAGYIWSYNNYQDKKRAMITGICTAFAAGVTKELYDSSIKGNYLDLQDLAATTLGGITITATIPLFQPDRYKRKRKRRKPKSRGKCGR
tara:strand:- start:246 stop:623 length:378 start_codon:yes stop_codon:yes gene_type:complete